MLEVSLQAPSACWVHQQIVAEGAGLRRIERHRQRVCVRVLAIALDRIANASEAIQDGYGTHRYGTAGRAHAYCSMPEISMVISLSVIWVFQQNSVDLHRKPLWRFSRAMKTPFLWGAVLFRTRPAAAAIVCTARRLGAGFLRLASPPLEPSTVNRALGSALD